MKKYLISSQAIQAAELLFDLQRWVGGWLEEEYPNVVHWVILEIFCQNLKHWTKSLNPQNSLTNVQIRITHLMSIINLVVLEWSNVL